MNKLKNALLCGSSLLLLSSSLSPVLADNVTVSSSSKSSADTVTSSLSSSSSSSSVMKNDVSSSSEVSLKTKSSSTVTESSKLAEKNNSQSESAQKATSAISSKDNDTSTVTKQSTSSIHSKVTSQSIENQTVTGSNQSGVIQDNVDTTDTDSASSTSTKSSSQIDDKNSTQSSNSTGAVNSTISISGGKQLVNVDKMVFDNTNDKLVANKDNILNINFAPTEKSNLKMTFKYNLQPTDDTSKILLHSKGIHITVNLVIPQKDGHDKIIKNVSPLITDENGEFTIDFKDLDGTQINSQSYLQIVLPDNVQINGKHNLKYKLNVTNPADKNKDQNKQTQGQKDSSQSVKVNDMHTDKKTVKVTSPTDFQKNVRHLQDIEAYNEEPATNQFSQMPAQLDEQGNPVTNTQKTAMLAQTNATNTHAKILTGIGIVTAMIATGIFAVQSKDKHKFS